MTATIPLAKGLNTRKLNFPVYVSRKYDGVPVRIDINEDGWTVVTRQGHDVPSVHRLVQEFYTEFCKYIDGRNVTLVGEVMQTLDLGAPFKDTGGIVRRQDDQSDKLCIMLFESSEPGPCFDDRAGWMLSLNDMHDRVHSVYQHRMDTQEQLDTFTTQLLLDFPEWEGLVIRNHDDQWLPGKRSWGYQKLLRKPTIDLLIIGCQEATSEDGEPKGMAGRLIAKYKGGEIGVGPGKLTHPERVSLLEYFRKPLAGPLMAQIGYKKDTSYKALREARFQCWRPEKETPDA